ncbi:hypothetical protein FRC01_005448, partial [Tulasnella sp. 417]
TGPALTFAVDNKYLRKTMGLDRKNVAGSAAARHSHVSREARALWIWVRAHPSPECPARLIKSGRIGLLRRVSNVGVAYKRGWTWKGTPSPFIKILIASGIL